MARILVLLALAAAVLLLGRECATPLDKGGIAPPAAYGKDQELPRSPTVELPPPTARAPVADKSLAKPASTAEYGRILVYSRDGAAVEAATVILGIEEHGVWKPQLEVQTNASGAAVIRGKLGSMYDALVLAQGYVPWFRAMAIGRGQRVVRATLERGEVIGGSVRAGETGVADVRVRLVARRGSAWPGPDFVADCVWPDPQREKGPPDRATVSRIVVTDNDGRFLFEGVDPAWTCIVGVDDSSLIMSPVATRVEPGDENVVLQVGRPTGLDITRRGGVPPVHASVMARCAVRNGNHSFSFHSASDLIRMRFSPPESWRDPLTYDVVLRDANGALARDSFSGSIGEIAAVVVEFRGDAPQRSLDVVVSWADGMPCLGGIMVAAEGPGGEPVEVSVLEQSGATYRLRVGANASRLRVLAKDCLRGFHQAPALDIHDLPKGSTISATMPRGADIVIYTPSGSDVSVLVSSSLGARTVRVNGHARLRGAEPGRVVATCSIDGDKRRSAVLVDSIGEYALDLTK